MQFLSTQMAVFLAVKATATGSPDHIRPILRVDQEASGLPSEGTADVPRNRIAQSFVPSFDAIGFVELYTADRDRDDGLGATISVALREESHEGPILARTRPLDVSDRFFGVSTLFFKTSVAVVPGRLLFLEPVLEVGPRWGFATSFGAPYDAGMLILNGTNRPQGDLWFREGVTAAVFNPPVVVDGKVRISWLGAAILEEALQSDGPWTPVDCDYESNTHVTDPALNSQKFFRLRS